MILIRLFIEFFKVGLFSVGGGLATLPFLYNLSDTMGWFTHGDIANLIAIAESTPGAIGINMSTYAGYLVAGVPGGVIATLGLVTPSVIIILFIAHMLHKFNDHPVVKAAFFGLRPASLAMIAAAGISVAKITLVNVDPSTFNIPCVLLAIVLYILSKKTKWHPVVLIILSGLIGMIFKFGSF